MERIPCVYILANKPNGTLYIGVTSQLANRIYQHKNNLVDGFSKKYEIHETMESAISREKVLKNWHRR